jgi:hypothetical protein
MVVLEPSDGSWWVQHWLAPKENTRISKVKQTRPQRRMKARKQAPPECHTNFSSNQKALLAP